MSKRLQIADCRLLIAIVAVALAGCAHVAKHYTAPSFAAMDASYTKAAAGVKAGRHAVARAKADIGEASTAADDEDAKLLELTPELDALLKAAPPDLRDQVQQEVNQVAALKAEHEQVIIPRINDGKAAVQEAEMQLAGAQAALDQHSKDMATVKAQADEITAGANKAELGWQHDSRIIVNSFWFKVGIGTLALVALAVLFLSFAGKFASAGAQIASKLP